VGTAAGAVRDNDSPSSAFTICFCAISFVLIESIRRDLDRPGVLLGVVIGASPCETSFAITMLDFAGDGELWP
jgi:hypothetical protein